MADKFTIEVFNLRRALRTNTILHIRPFATGYKYGWYVEHCTK